MALLSLIAKLGLDKTGFDAGMRAAGKQVSGFGADLKSQLAGAFSIAAAAQFLRGIEQTVGRIKDLSEQFGITTTEVQNTDFALKQSGLAFEDIGQALNKLTIARREAVEGNNELRQTFAKFGLTLQDLNDPALRTYDVLQRISKATAGGNMTAREQSDLMDLIGARAGKLVNVLSQLEAIKPPAIFQEDDIERIDKLSKSFENLKLTLQASVAPALIAVFENLRSGLNSIREGRILDAMNRMNPLTAGVQIASDMGKRKAEDQSRAEFAVAENASKSVMALLSRIFPGGAAGDGLWQVDRNAKAENAKSQTARSVGIESDAFGRIGAFTGAAAQSAQLEVARRQLSQIEQLRADLIRRGILVKGTD